MAARLSDTANPFAVTMYGVNVLVPPVGTTVPAGTTGVDYAYSGEYKQEKAEQPMKPARRLYRRLVPGVGIIRIEVSGLKRVYIGCTSGNPDPIPAGMIARFHQKRAHEHPMQESGITVCPCHGAPVEKCDRGHWYCTSKYYAKTCIDCKTEVCAKCPVAMIPHSHRAYKCPPCNLKGPLVLVEGYVKGTRCRAPDGCGSPLKMCGEGGWYCPSCTPSETCQTCQRVFCMYCEMKMHAMHNYTVYEQRDGCVERFVCTPCWMHTPTPRL